MKCLRYENGFLNLTKFDDFFILSEDTEGKIFLRFFCYQGVNEGHKLLIDVFPYNEKNKEEVTKRIENLKKFIMDSINDFLESDNDKVIYFLQIMDNFNSMGTKVQA